MATPLAPPAPTSLGPPTPGRRVGYVVAIGTNAMFLWVSHQLLDWGWPAFLTEDFAQVLGLVTATFVAGIVANAVYLVRDRGRVRSVGEIVTTAFGLAVALRLWDVFPFDFAATAIDWTGPARVLLVIVMVGAAIGLLVHGGRLVTGDDGPPGPTTRQRIRARRA